MIRKKTNYHVATLFLPEGVGSNGTTSDLFTMSKYPAVDPYGSTQPNFALCHTRKPVRDTAIAVSTNPKKKWWSQTGSNRRHPACKAGALPAELWPHFLCDRTNKLVGPGGLEPPTSRLSGVRSNHLSYGPPDVVWTGLF